MGAAKIPDSHEEARAQAVPIETVIDSNLEGVKANPHQKQNETYRKVYVWLVTSLEYDI